MQLKKISLIATAVAAAMFTVSAYAANSDLEDSIVLAEEAIAEMQKQNEYAMDVSGYADVEYVMEKDKPAGFRMHHLSLFFQKKVSEKWHFFSEIEYEDGVLFELQESSKQVDVNNTPTKLDYVSGDAEGKIFVEAVNLSYQWRPEAIFRFGRFFTPAGIWSIDHYPPFVSTQERPGHIRKIFPQLVDGAMAYGTMRMGNTFLNYDAYVSNGEGNTGKKDKNDEKAFGLKTSLNLPVPMFKQFEIGGTYYADSKDSKNGDQSKTSMGGHAKIRMMDFTLQSEAAYAKFDADSGSATPTISGYYAQLTYALSNWGVGYRYDNYDSNRSSKGEKVTNTLFANYRLTHNLVMKLEHHLVDDNGTESSKTIASMAAYLD